MPLWHVGSPQTRDRTHIPCTGRRIFNSRTTREAPVSLFPQLPLPSTGGLMNVVATAVRMGVIRGLSNTDFHSPRLTWLQPPLRAQSASPQTHRASGRALLPRVISQLPGGRLITVNHLHDKRAAFCSYWDRQVLGQAGTLDIDLPSLQANVLAQTSMAALVVQRLGIHPPMQKTRI